MTSTPIREWLIFAALIVALLAIDLGVLHRKAHEIKVKEALIEGGGWIAASLLFCVWIYFSHGAAPAIQFLTAYLVEKSLSVDNILVFLLIFHAFQIPAKAQHKVLYWGVLGALLMRALFIFAGVELLAAFHPVLYIFGGILLITGARLLRPKSSGPRRDVHWIVRWASRIMPVAHEPDATHFWTRQNGRRMATPLLIGLLAIEIMDIVFAMDSVPAVLAISRDTFIVYASNAFAILGLRALYFALAGVLPRLRYLHQGLAAVLLVMGLKMIGSDWVHLSDLVSLGIVATILAITVAASLLRPKTELHTDETTVS